MECKKRFQEIEGCCLALFRSGRTHTLTFWSIDLDQRSSEMPDISFEGSSRALRLPLLEVRKPRFSQVGSARCCHTSALAVIQALPGASPDFLKDSALGQETLLSNSA